MKRAAELRELSDDHHQGLVQARRLRKVAAGEGAVPLEEAARAFLKFWQGDTSGHFRREEEVLLPVLARYGQDALGRGCVVEMLTQHARIRGLVMQLSDEYTDGDLRTETIGEIGELLETHIRLEEREVFPMLEEVLPEIALEEVASRLAVKDAGPRVEPWVPTEGGLSYDPLPGPGDSEGGGYDWPSRRSPR
jgi:hemerythrin-like domain-containing protein